MQHQRKELVAAKWKVEHDSDLQVDLTHAPGQAIIIIRKKENAQ